jgi:hypothetical protein
MWKPSYIIVIVLLALLVRTGPAGAAHPDTGTSASFEGTFDPQTALTLLHGAETPADVPGRDPKTLRVWHDIQVPERLAKYFPVTDGEVFVAFEAPYSEAGIQKHIVITATEPPGGNGCHACSLLIGGAVFRQVGARWAVEAANKYIGVDGIWGRLGDISLVKIGPERFGVLSEGDDDSQGYMNKHISLIVPYGQSLVHALQYFVEGPTEIHCGRGDYIEPRIGVRFLGRNRGGPYYSVHTLIQYNSAKDCAVVPTKELRVFAFEKGQYRMTKRTIRRGRAFCCKVGGCFESEPISPVCKRELGLPN